MRSELPNHSKSQILFHKKKNIAGLSFNDFGSYYWKSRALHQHASSSKSHFIILDFCSTLILCGIYWTAVLWRLFVLALSTFCQKVCTIKPGRSGICFSRAYWNRSYEYEILSNTYYPNIFGNLFRQRYIKKHSFKNLIA